MSKKPNDVIEHAVHFLKSLKADGRGDVERAVGLLLDLQKNKYTTTPPIAEIITIIKYEKPILYELLKQRLKSNFGLNMLFQLHLNYEDVKKQLNYD